MSKIFDWLKNEDYIVYVDVYHKQEAYHELSTAITTDIFLHFLDEDIDFPLKITLEIEDTCDYEYHYNEILSRNIPKHLIDKCIESLNKKIEEFDPNYYHSQHKEWFKVLKSFMTHKNYMTAGQILKEIQK